MKKRLTLLFVALACPLTVFAQDTTHRVLATNKTSTMQSEMQDAGASGFRFAAVMGGETAGGKEVVVIMQKPGAATASVASKFDYRLLATNKTSTMQKEIEEAAAGGFQYVGQTVFESAFGGNEVVCIFERDSAVTSAAKYEYRLFATSKTSTMEKELKEPGDAGFVVVGMTVAKTAMGGNELVAIARRVR